MTLLLPSEIEEFERREDELQRALKDLPRQRRRAESDVEYALLAALEKKRAALGPLTLDAEIQAVYAILAECGGWTRDRQAFLENVVARTHCSCGFSATERSDVWLSMEERRAAAVAATYNDPPDHREHRRRGACKVHGKVVSP
jgi:hypothetical protein